MDIGFQKQRCQHSRGSMQESAKNRGRERTFAVSVRTRKDKNKTPSKRKFGAFVRKDRFCT